jgi:hypothetical protein
MRTSSSALLGATGLSPRPPILCGRGEGRLDVAPPARTVPVAVPAPRRTRLDELHGSLHCSVIGTCFGLRELRQLMVKFVDPGLASAGDHTIHTEAVRCASRREGIGRALGKALDRKFSATITQFARASDVPALRRLWIDALARGEIPGAYWALLTHPAGTKELIGEAFSDVHMLSHLVGAANRADIRRLQDLERDKADLEDKLARQQRHLNETLGAKERQIRELLAALAEREHGAPIHDNTADLLECLKRERRRRMQLERRIATLEVRLAAATEPTRGRSAEDTGPVACCEHHELPPSSHLELDRRTVLLIGGRPTQVRSIAGAVAEAGGFFLHHDGGVEMRLGLLPGLVNRADHIVVALDSVSHAAANTARRRARAGEKAVTVLPSLSLTGISAALARAEAERRVAGSA